MSDGTEARLVRQAKDGDIEAFEALYRLYNERIYNFSKQITGSADDACDVVQETFIRAWKSLPDLRSDGTFGGWLHRIALNRSKDVLKKRTLKPTIEIAGQSNEDGETLEMQFENDSPTPEQQFVSSELGEVIRNSIAKLSEDHRIVVTMHHLEEMDISSIAEILKLPKGTVMSRLSRAREILKRKLTPYLEEVEL